MMKFQERKIKKLKKEYDKTRELLIWAYDNPEENVYDTFTDLYLPKNACFLHAELRKIRNRVKSIAIKNSRIRFFNLPQVEKNHKMRELEKEFDIIF